MRSILLGSPIDWATLKRELPPGFSVQNTGQKHLEFDHKGFSLFLLVVSWAASIPAAVIANAIYDAIKRASKKKPTRISINKVQIDFKRGTITKYFEEHTDLEKDADE